MRFNPASPAKSERPGQARAAEINLGSLGQISSSLWLDHTASPYAAYGVAQGPTPGTATQPSAYPLALAAIQTALEFLDPGCLQNSGFFRAPETTAAHQPAWDSPALGTPAQVPTPPRQPRKPATLQQPALGGTALTLSAPIAGSGNLILAARNPSRATNPLAQAKAPTRPARQNVAVRQSWLRTATKSPAFALSSAAINGLMLLSPLVSFAQTTTTYGTGGSSAPYTGGIINPGDTVILNDGATVSGADPITANGTLQFNQTTNLTITNNLTGSGSLALINTGNLTLADNTYVPDYNDSFSIPINIFDVGISLTQGSLFVGADGGNGLAIGTVSNGSLTINGGTVQNIDGYLGVLSGSNGTATVATGGTWTNTGDLTIGLLGNGTLTVSGGNVSNVNGVIGAMAGDEANNIAGSNGTVTISSGNWTNTGSLTVGSGGNGNLMVSGGNVSDVNGAIGYNSAATISGGNWINSGNLYIATNNSTLTIETGGLVTVAGTLTKTPTGIINLNTGGSLSIGAGGTTTGILQSNGFDYAGTLIFNRSVSGYTFDGSLGGSGSLIKDGSNILTLRGNSTYTGTTTINAGTLQIGNGSDNASISNSSIINNASLVFKNNASKTHAAQISGSGILEKRGGGTLTLSGNNTFTGNTTIYAGTLQIGDGGTSGSLVSNVSGGPLVFNRSDSSTYGGVFSGSTLAKLGAGTLTLTGNNTNSGTTTISAGTLQIGAGGTSGAISNSSSIVNNANLAFNRSDTTSYAGAISGTGNLTQLGAGTLALSGTNTYTGTTTISAGTLQIGAGGNSGGISNSSTITNNANLAFDRSNDYTYGGLISGGGTLAKLGVGTLTLSGNNTYTGTTTISAGTLQIGAGGTSGSMVSTITNNANLAFSRSDATTYAGMISGSGSLSKQGSGILTLSGNNTYTGNTTIDSGTLLVSGLLADSSNVSVSQGATYQLGSTDTIGSIAGAGTIDLASFNLIAGGSNGNTIFEGVMAGTGAFAKAGLGTLTLTGTNTYTGETTISDGTLQIGSGGTSGSISNSATITNNANLAFNRSDAMTYGGLISGSGNLNQLGSGTLTLTGSNSYTGSSTVGGAGTLRVEGSIAPSSGLTVNSGATLSGNGSITGTTINAGGILAPNNAGSGALAITGGSGTLNLAAGSISNFSINNANADRVTASGSINLDGVLNLAFSGDNYLTSAPYTLFLGQSRSGTFSAANVSVSGLSSAYQYALDYTATALNLQVISVIPAGQSANITNPSSTTLSGGTLVINQPGSYNTSLVLTTPSNPNATSTIDGNGVTAELSGTISGNGSLAISNSQNSTTSSTTNLTGNSTYTGSTTVESGANLFVNGSIAASANLTIQAGASIGGNGTLPMTTVQSGGSIAAGNSIGNLTVSGNLALNSGSTSRFEVGSASADRLTVTGSSALGGNVTLAFSGGNYDAVNPYTLVAAQSITTPFDAITTTGDLTGYRYNLTYNPTTVQLALAKVLDTGMTTSISNPWSSTLAGGTVSVDANGSFANNWTLSAPSGSSANTFEQSGSLATLQGVISGPGDLTIAANAAGGTLILAGNNSYTGNSNLSGGTIGLASASALGTAGTISLTGGTLLYGTGITTDYSDRFSHGANQSYNVNTNGQVVTFASDLDSHGGTLTKVGDGTLILSGNNTYAGVTTIQAGTLQVGSGSNTGAISDASSMVNHATLAFGRSNATTYAGQISGSGSLVQLGLGTLALSGLNSYTGATTITSVSTLALWGSGSISTSSGVSNSGNFSIAGATSPVSLINLSGSGSTILGNQSLTISEASGLNSGVISGSGGALSLNGTGTYSLSGINTYMGATTIGSGETLALEGSGSIAASSGVFNSGNFSIAAATSPASVTNLTGSGGTTLGNQSLTITDASGLNSGVISGLGGSLSINGSGTYSLSGINTYTGVTSIGSGETLALEGSGSIAASCGVFNSGNFSIASATSPVSLINLSGSGSTNLGNQSLTLTGASGMNSGVISGSGGNLMISGSSAYTLGGVNTYSGSTELGGTLSLRVDGSIAPSSALMVNSGATLAGSGLLPTTSVATGAILAPNNAGGNALSVAGGAGNLTLATGSISNFSILATTSDRVAATGTITLAGSLNLAFSADSYLTATPYVLFSGQSLRGSFGSVAVSGLSSSYVYSLDYGATALNLWVTASVPAGQSTDITSPTATTLSGGTILINEPGAYNTRLVLYAPGSSTNTIDANGLTAVLSGTISGTGPITFINSLNSSANSDIILSGNNTYTGATVVNTGVRLSVNGSIASSANLTVNRGAIVGGHGSLPATMIQSGGHLAPGNSIGRLTVSSLSFGPGGLVDLEIQGPQNDKTTVTGSVTNFTGTANLIAYGGGTPWPNLDYQLITAANSFAASSSLSLNPVGITSALLLQGTTLVQEVDGNGHTFDVMWRPNNGSGATVSAMQALGQGNRNQLAASGVFDSAFRRLAVAAGDASGLTTGLNATGTAFGTTGFTTGQAAAAGLTPEFLSTTAQLLGISSNSQLSAAISTITPESYAAFQSVGLETLQRQRQQLLASAGQCASNGWVINGPTSKAAKAPPNPICLYGQAANANSSINGQDGLSGYNANLFSSFYGLEVKANPYWNFGAAYGYGTSNLNGLGPTNAWVTATVNSGSLYGVYIPTTTSPWTFKGLLGYGNYALNGSRRVASIGTGSAITGSTTANGLTAALTAEVAIPLTKPSAPVPVLLKPLIGIAYGNYQQAGFSETGGGPLNLNVDGNTASSLVGTIGLELTSGPIPLNRAKTLSLIPRVALAYQVDALASELGNSSLSASMPASGSGAFLSQGQNRGVNGFAVAAGVDLILTKSTALYANVNIEAFSAGSQVGYGGGLRFKF